MAHGPAVRHPQGRRRARRERRDEAAAASLSVPAWSTASSAFEGDNKCTGVKSVTINEPYFQGHFPGHPVMPGVLQLEAMAQVAQHPRCCASRATRGKIGYFMSADDVKFRKPVVPGRHALHRSRNDQVASATSPRRAAAASSTARSSPRRK